MRLSSLLFAVLLALGVAGCSKKSETSGGEGGMESKMAPANPDEQACLALADKAASCAKSEARGRRVRHIILRACQRDLKDPETRPLQMKLCACAKIADCAKHEACREKASGPLRDLHFKRIRKRRAK